MMMIEDDEDAESILSFTNTDTQILTRFSFAHARSSIQVRGFRRRSVINYSVFRMKLKMLIISSLAVSMMYPFFYPQKLQSTTKMTRVVSLWLVVVSILINIRTLEASSRGTAWQTHNNVIDSNY
jgi:hypothetical protein